MEKQQKKRAILRFVSYILVASLASLTTLLFFGGNSKLVELRQVITHNFVGETSREEMEDAAAHAMVASLGDRWSYYIPASQYESFMEGKTNSYVGIGISIVALADGSGFEIVQVEPDSSAQQAGILPGDILIAADGRSLAGMDIEMPGQIIKGKEGTSVRVTVLRGEEELSFSLLRQQIESDVAWGEMLEDDVGYVCIKNFNTNCAAHTIATIESLVEQGAKSLVFDVRNNSGGYVTELVDVLDHLLPEGLLFRSVRDGKTEEYTSDEDCLEMPMAVLVNGNSYSAAEFFAAALSEYDWALIAGTPTCGKSYFQTTFRLRDGSAIGLSVGQYYTPKGVSLAEEGGLIPDITVEVTEDTEALIYSRQLPLKEDPQLLAALDALKENG